MLTIPEIRLGANALKIVKRNFGILAPALQKASDPIQQLFLDKIREYRSKAESGKLDMPPEYVAERASEMQKIATQFNFKGTEYNEFPAIGSPKVKIEVSLSERHSPDVIARMPK